MTYQPWVSRDRAGVTLWEGRPIWCLGDKTFFNGGRAMSLPDEAFPGLPMGRCAPVECTLAHREVAVGQA